MKILNVTPITDSKQLKIKKGTLQFLQDANYEAFQAVVRASIGSAYNPSLVYIMFGCVNSGTGNSYDITAGAVFYNGEIYLVDATSFIAAGSNVGVFQAITTQYTNNADPVTYTDSSVGNVHNIRKFQIVQGATGSGVSDFSTAAPFSFTVNAPVNIKGTGAVTVSGSYPNLTVDVPLNANRYPALYAGTVNVGNPSGGADVIVSFASLGTANYYVMGTIVSNNESTDPNGDSTLIWTIRGRTTTGFILHVYERLNATQNVSFEFILFAK